MADLENMTIKEIRKEIARLEGNSRELGEIRATLVVNCRRGRRLAQLNISYADHKSVLNNLIEILQILVRKIDAKGS